MMKMKNLIKGSSILIISSIIASCATTPDRATEFEPKTEVRVVTDTVYPTLSQINVPDEPNLRTFDWDYPRDLTADQIIQNRTDCINVPVSEQDQEFWEQCGIFPIDENSNLFIGLSQEHFNNINFNFQSLKEYIDLLKSRIAIANDQRSEFNEKAND